MARVIKEVGRPHDCHAELRRDLSNLDLWPGSVAECSCGNTFVLRDDQRDGPMWNQTLGKVRVVHRYTSHGHPCCRLCPRDAVATVHRCGGVGRCTTCGPEADSIHAAEGTTNA